MRTSFLVLGSLLWAGVAVVATPCRPAKPSSSSASPSSSSSAAPSASPSSACAVVGIQNPSFASGLDDWSTTTYSDGTFSVEASTDCGAGVASCAVLYSQAGQSSTTGTASVFQANLPVVNGASYTLSYDYRITAAGSGIMGLFLNGLPAAGTAAGTLNEWATKSFTFPASGDTLSIALFQRTFGGSMTIQITNVQLVTCGTSFQAAP